MQLSAAPSSPRSYRDRAAAACAEWASRGTRANPVLASARGSRALSSRSMITPREHGGQAGVTGQRRRRLVVCRSAHLNHSRAQLSAATRTPASAAPAQCLLVLCHGAIVRAIRFLRPA